MKRKLRFLPLLLLLLGIMCICTACNGGGGANDPSAEQLKFELKDDGTYAVSIGTAVEQEEIVIPSTLHAGYASYIFGGFCF